MFTAFRRSGYLFFLAFAFRLQLWIFGLPAPWTDLLRVDILNCMGFAIAVLSVMALFRTAERVRLCAVLGLAIAFASPLVSQMDWSGVPWLMRGYIVARSAVFRLLPVGRVPGVRHERRQRHPRRSRRKPSSAPCNGGRCWAGR